MKLGVLLASLGACLLGACATITPQDTHALVNSATSLRAALHTETAAIDSAFQTISESTDAVCANPALQAEYAAWCTEWKPPAGHGAPGASRTQASAMRGGLATVADAGMDEIVAYVQALEAMAQAGQDSVAAAASVNRRLGALAGLLDAADGPLSFIGGDAFGTALKALAQIQAAHQVRRTLRAATAEAQLTLDLYALAMRNTLGACSVAPPAALLARIREGLPRAFAGVPEGAALAERVRTALADLGSERDPCRSATYAQFVASEGRALLIAEQFRTSFNFAALQSVHDQSGEVSAAIAETVADLEEAGAFGVEELTPAQTRRIRALMARLRQLHEVQGFLAPYQEQAQTLMERETAARRFAQDRQDGAVRLARGFFALAQSHREFAQTVEKRRGLDLSTIFAPPAPSAETGGE